MASRNNKSISCVGVLFVTLSSVFIILYSGIYILSKLFSFELPGQSIRQDLSIDLSPATKISEQSTYEWKYSDDNLNRYHARLQLRIPYSEVQVAMKLIYQLGEATYEELGLEHLQESDDSIYIGKEVWGLLYKRIVRQGRPQLRVFNEKLEEYFISQKMDKSQIYQYLTTLVQNITYKIPTEDLGLLPPIASLARRFGDCDTKALLLYILLEYQKMPSVVMWSGYYSHAMLGVSIPATGDYKKHKGRKYYFQEVTTPGWTPGQLSPDVNNTDYWFALDLVNEIY